ncbi:MAG TPA: hypothetical protein HA230_03805 [Candidatus Aenigmarchaeota archaeon]|nr:hypothetical protein [Candidatus Aenigmarchaeota archaeon]
MDAGIRRELRKNRAEYERLVDLGVRLRVGTHIVHDGRLVIRYLPPTSPKDAARDYQNQHSGAHFLAVYVEDRNVPTHPMLVR